jgi:hypothetical protein
LSCENGDYCLICNGENRNKSNFCFCNDDSNLNYFYNSCTVKEGECINNKFKFKDFNSPGIAMGLLYI